MMCAGTKEDVGWCPSGLFRSVAGKSSIQALQSRSVNSYRACYKGLRA